MIAVNSAVENGHRRTAPDSAGERWIVEREQHS
jgi:hypothetical protein